MADFPLAFGEVIDRHEGKWGIDKSDPGKETCYGISKRFYPDDPIWPRIDAAKARPGFPGSLNSDATLQMLVRDHYRRHEWAAVRGNEIPSQVVATELLDNATLEGDGVSIALLQFALNALNRGATWYADVTVDGAFGERTMLALDALLVRGGEGDLAKLLNVLQGMYLMIGAPLIQFLKDHPTPAWRERFLPGGWLDRITI